MLVVLPVSVNKRMEDGEISLDGDGDSHEDADAEEDVVKGVEEVGEEVVVDPGYLSWQGAHIAPGLLEVLPSALSDAENQK